MRVQIITVPYRYDERNDGLGRGPQALVDAGIAAILRTAGHDVLDPVDVTLPDDERVSGPISVNIGRLGSHTAEQIHAARTADHVALVLAGDDTASIGVVAGLQRAHGAGARIGLVWVDAHGDFNTPETSYSGILAGMPVAILAGLAGPLWREAAGLAAPLPTDRILIVGPRELDEKEEALLRSTDVQLLTSSDLRDADQLTRAIQRLAANVGLISVHIDLDVLDPSLVPSASTPARGGMMIGEAATLIVQLLETGKVAVVS
ncbi:MAG TPA: arginase family protein, partial [Thermomicrobiales bacterium]|nr:arginase family protein [Thermomicrobiales bacterium]